MASTPAILADSARASALEHETIYVGAWRRGLEIELATADLVRLTDAEVRPIALG